MNEESTPAPEFKPEPAFAPPEFAPPAIVEPAPSVTGPSVAIPGATISEEPAVVETLEVIIAEPPAAPEITIVNPADDAAATAAPSAPSTQPTPLQRQPQRPPDAARSYRGLRLPTLDVWPFLSRRDLLARWLGDTDLELVIGGDFSLHAWNGDSVRGHVLQSDPPSTLALTWKSQGMTADSRVTFRLQGDGPGTRISVRHEGLASDPERRQARRMWREILGALRAAIQEDRDAHEWGATLPISVRMPLARSAHDIWPLLSTSQGLAKWIGHIDRFDAVAEGAFRFTTRTQNRDVIEEGLIEQMQEESRVVLAWQWADASWSAPTKVEWTLEPDPSGSALLLLHAGFDRIAVADAAAARRYYAVHWPRIMANLRRLVAPIHA